MTFRCLFRLFIFSAFTTTAVVLASLIPLLGWSETANWIAKIAIYFTFAILACFHEQLGQESRRD